ncbi:hypothetical protein CAL30_01845 [Megasphaera hutchinsoni]|jgi:hypothetical protein|uniref:Uncharacterized protein n=1 Tax=Megasphaera hutchinsoni TaxID=1588748 RepID=A0A2J8BC47_9FIRM|nr:hypothetical protein [Megasphaera genomosp. type_2]PNH22349.1 hypothetical protein CAL30_01845 [Megasphaera genomosp. type_2]
MKSIKDYDVFISIQHKDQPIHEQIKITATAPRKKILVDTFRVNGEEDRFLEICSGDDGKPDFTTLRHVRLDEDSIKEANKALIISGTIYTKE